MKNLFIKLICVFALITMSASAFAEKFEFGGINYEISSTNSSEVIVVARDDKYTGSITIPSTVDYKDKSFSVTTIGENAFSHCDGLVSIVIPNSVTTIEDYAFFGCSNLESVELSASLSSIGSWGFSSTSKLSNISLPVSLKTIKSCAFNGSGLKSIFIPENVYDIQGNAFGGCENLVSIEVDKNNKFYDSQDNCNAIIKGDILVSGCKTTSIPSAINTIGENAFSLCTGLVSIVIPNSVTTIEDYAFFGCSNLESVELSTSLSSIGSNAFRATSKLYSITLPSSVKEIKSNAFNGSGLKSIFIPENVYDIQGNAFDGCENLVSIEVDKNNKFYDSQDNCNAIIKGDILVSGCKTTSIPSAINTIGENAFSLCTGLVSIVIPNSVTTIEDYAFFGCSNLESVELSTSLSSIGSNAFSATLKLYSITLPSSVKEIKSNAFYGSELKTIISEIYTPFSIDKSVFDDYYHNCYNNATLYVKEGRVSIYQNTDGWKEFANIHEIESNINYSIGSSTTTISYYLNPILKTGTIIGINSTDENISIPDKITYKDEEYLINKIQDGVLAHKDFVTITFPKQKQILGTGVFEGSYKLSAIIWNREDCPSGELISSIENPNLLFYVNSVNAAPRNLSNVIINGVAETIVLTDAPESNFYCPKQFTAEKISYTHKYTLKTEKGVVQGWESIALPFDVQTYETMQGETKPYAMAATGDRRFWLRELTSGGFKEANGIKANVPYIISMPNWEGYQDFYNIEGDVVFSSKNAVVPKTNIKEISFDNRIFWPCFSTLKSQNDIYVLNKDKIEDYNPGSSFMNNIRKTNPFECYFTYSGSAVTRAINIGEMLGETTIIDDNTVNLDLKIENGSIYINSPHDGLLVIYTLTGQLVKKVNLTCGRNVVNGLSRGIYIINGNKITIP